MDKNLSQNCEIIEIKPKETTQNYAVLQYCTKTLVASMTVARFDNSIIKTLKFHFLSS